MVLFVLWLLVIGLFGVVVVLYLFVVFGVVVVGVVLVFFIVRGFV